MNDPVIDPQSPSEFEPAVLPEAQSPEPPAQKRIRGNAVQRLAKATAQVVLQHTDEIAQALCDRALKADISSVKLLLELIEKIPPPPPRKQKSMAEMLANSPQWDPEREEAGYYDDK